MKLTKRNLILIFVPITFMLVIVLFPGFFYQNLIDPITRIFWLLIRSILSINQEILWTLLIVIALVVGLMMIPVSGHDDLRSAYTYSDRTETRVSSWKTLFQSAEKSKENRQLLLTHLDDLSRSITETTGKSEKTEISIRNSGFGFSRIMTRAWRVFKRRFFPNREEFTDIELERYVNQKLDSLESILERQNERSSSNSKNS